MKRVVIILIVLISVSLFAHAQADEDLFVADSAKNVFIGDRPEFLKLFNTNPTKDQPEQSYVAICTNKSIARATKKTSFQSGVTVFFQDELRRWQAAAIFYRYKKSDTSGHIKQILVSPNKKKLAIKIKSNFLKGEKWFLYEFKKKASYWVDRSEKKYKDSYVHGWIN